MTGGYVLGILLPPILSTTIPEQMPLADYSCIPVAGCAILESGGV